MVIFFFTKHKRKERKMIFQKKRGCSRRRIGVTLEEIFKNDRWSNILITPGIQSASYQAEAFGSLTVVTCHWRHSDLIDAFVVSLFAANIFVHFALRFVLHHTFTCHRLTSTIIPTWKTFEGRIILCFACLTFLTFKTKFWNVWCHSLFFLLVLANYFDNFIHFSFFSFKIIYEKKVPIKLKKKNKNKQRLICVNVTKILNINLSKLWTQNTQLAFFYKKKFRVKMVRWYWMTNDVRNKKANIIHAHYNQSVGKITRRHCQWHFP